MSDEANNNLIPPHGGYRKLMSYQMAEIVYDATVKFCERFIDKRSRTFDQMVQVLQIEALVDKIRVDKKSHPQSDTSNLKRQIDELVYKLYDLTEEKIKIIKGNE